MTPALEHEDAIAQDPQAPAHSSNHKHRRTMTSTDEIDSTIIRPGSVKINVKGAFIVDPDTATPASTSGASAGAVNSINGRMSPTHPETSDIRLPYHTAIVSHIAIDVCILFPERWSQRKAKADRDGPYRLVVHLSRSSTFHVRLIPQILVAG